MQLEKATSTNSEAGLAGWISSNDVTLFTMVLVVIVALFLHGKLIRGQTENAALSQTNQSLNQEVETTASERDKLNAALRQSRQDFEREKRMLALTADDLKKAEGELAASQQDRAKLNQDLLKAIKDIGALNTEKSDLIEKGINLDTQVDTLKTDKQGLEKERRTLTERLEDIATKLKERTKVLDELKLERDRLQEQSKSLDAIVADLKDKLGISDAKLKAMAAQASETEAESEKRIAALEKSADDEAKRAADYLTKLRRAADLFQGLKKSNASLEQKLDGAEKRYQRQLMLETTVNRKLVGINGKLKRVAILFDASGSMKQKDEEAGGDRWQDAQSIASTWLGHLDVDECVLIVFSSDVRTFPTDGTMSKIQGPEGEANRAKLMEQLKSVEPEGWTNTLEALEKAYSYPGVDTILLFSDGAPTFANSGRFDPNVAERIYELCRKHPDVPVNTVGLGNYFDQNLSTFLRTVANVSGGTFRGR